MNNELSKKILDAEIGYWVQWLGIDLAESYRVRKVELKDIFDVDDELLQEIRKAYQVKNEETTRQIAKKLYETFGSRYNRFVL